MKKPDLDWTTVLLLIGLPVLLVSGLLMPEWIRFFLQISLATGLAALGVMIQMRAGLVPFGQGLYYCLGGYAAGMSGTFLGITDAFALLALGLGLSTVIAAILGLLMARYREIYYAMLSLALSMILYGLLVKAEVLGSTDGFNLPKATFLGYAPEGEALRYATFALTCSVTTLLAVLLHRFLVSPLGYVGEAIRENELRVEYLGTSPSRLIYFTYLVAAAVSGAGGVLAAIAVGHVDPDMAYWTTSGHFVFVALLSGNGNVIAPLAGSFILELVRVYAVEFSPNTWQMILGGVMLLVIIFLPNGLWSLVGMSRARRRST